MTDRPRIVHRQDQPAPKPEPSILRDPDTWIAFGIVVGLPVLAGIGWVLWLLAGR